MPHLDQPEPRRRAFHGGFRPPIPPPALPAAHHATVPEKIDGLLVERSDQEGRSVSNLVAFLLERALTPPQSAASAPDRIRWS